MTSREQRALARGTWTARLVRGSDPGEEAPLELTPDEAWVAVGELTRSLWLLQGGTDERPPGAQWPADADPACPWNDDFLDLADAAWLDTAFPPTTR